MAVKEFHTTDVRLGVNESIAAEQNAWETYEKASLEARVMVQLQHPHILNLIGVTLQPLRLLVEMAPIGDMKYCIQKFKKASIRLRRKTIKTTLLQARTTIVLYNKHSRIHIVSFDHIIFFQSHQLDNTWYFCIRRNIIWHYNTIILTDCYNNNMVTVLQWL